MLRIAFDYQIFMNQQYGGISRYFAMLAHELIHLGQDVKIVAPCYQNRYLPRLIPPEHIAGFHLPHPPHALVRKFIPKYNKWLSEYHIPRFRPQIIHETYYRRYRTGIGDYKRVVTVYDMIHELFPGDFPNDPTSHLKRLAVQRADHVICISENTRNDLIRLFNLPPEKTSVVYLGCDFSAPLTEKEDISRSDEKPFLLYVGGRNGYKNFSGFLRGVACSPMLKNDFDIIAFGGGAFLPSEQELIRQLGFQQDQVRQIGGGDEVLAELYRKARALIYPSLYEGFGIPPIEAMAHQCPVICSNSSSIPEVTGSAAAYFDPSDFEDIRHAMEQTVYSEITLQELIQAGNKQYPKFSWRQCAENTLSIYQALCPT